MPPGNNWPAERNVATSNWRPHPPTPASSPAAVRGCGRRGECGNSKAMQTSFLALKQGQLGTCSEPGAASHSRNVLFNAPLSR